MRTRRVEPNAPGLGFAHMDPFNLFDATVPQEVDESRPEGFRRLHLSIGALVGASQIGATLYELPPGQRICPYHYEYNNEEWMLVLEGRPTLRTPSGERELRPGDVVAFPEGQRAPTPRSIVRMSVSGS